MGDILIHLASRMLRLLGLWSCGDRASDLHQIPRLAHPAQRTRTEPTALRVDVAQFDVGVTHQPVTALGLEDADRLANQRLTDKDQLARPFDLPVAAHPAHRNVLAIGADPRPDRDRAAAKPGTTKPASAVPAPRAAAHDYRRHGRRRTAVAAPANWRPEVSPSLA